MVSSFRIWILTTSHTSSLSGQIWRRLATGRSSSLKRMVMRSILWTLGSRNYPNVSLRGGHLYWLSFWIRTWRWTTPEFSLPLPRGLLLLKLLLAVFAAEADSAAMSSCLGFRLCVCFWVCFCCLCSAAAAAAAAAAAGCGIVARANAFEHPLPTTEILFV